VVAHCAGSLVLFASLLSGALDGKVRSVVASQVAAHPIPAPFNSYKSSLRLPDVAHAFGVRGLTVDTGKNLSFFGRIFNGFSRAVVNHLVLDRNERCQSPVCSRWVIENYRTRFWFELGLGLGKYFFHKNVSEFDS
jgi:hypothetical protein